MTPELIQLFSNAGIAGLLAAVVIYFWRADHKERQDEERGSTERERDDKMQMLNALQNNTRVLSEMVTLIRSLTRTDNNGE